MPQALVPGIAEKLIEDLRAAVEYAKSVAGTEAKTSALYGLAGSVEGNARVTEMLHGLFDHLYSV
jgi:hypothetical protein